MLFQIDRGFHAQWGDLELSVRMEMSQWIVRVRSKANHRTLYTAYRCSLSAAQQSAADFAVFHVWGFDGRFTGSQLSSQLNWKRTL